MPRRAGWADRVDNARAKARTFDSLSSPRPAVAFSYYGSLWIRYLFRSALEYSQCPSVVTSIADLSLSANGVMHEGAVSARLGLPGMPASAEETAVARDIALAQMTGARVHLTHLSTAGSIDLVRRAKVDGTRITCDVTPHHLAMTDEWVAGSRAFVWEVEDEALLGVPYDSSTKVNPPLRTRADVRALWADSRMGLSTRSLPTRPPRFGPERFVRSSAFGISGLETALPLVWAA